MIRNMIIIFIIICMLAVCSCTASNESNIVHGINKKISSTEKLAKKLINDEYEIKNSEIEKYNTLLSSNNSMENMLYDGRNIIWEYSNDATEVKIDAKIDKVNSENIIGGIIESCSITDETIINACIDGDYTKLIKKFNQKDSVTEIYLLSDNSKELGPYDEELLSFAPGNIQYVNHKLCKKELIDFVPIQDTNGLDLEFTIDKAKAKADKFIEELDVEDIEYTTYEIYYSNRTNDVIYDLKFYSKIGEIGFVGSSAPDIVVPSGNIVIGKNGIFATAGNYLFKVTEEQVKNNLLTLNDMLEILPMIIDKYYFHMQYISIESINIKYCAKKTSAFVIELFPVWTLEFKNDDPKDIYSQEILINAVTGQLESLN